MRCLVPALCILALTACNNEPANPNSSVTVELAPARPADSTVTEPKRNDIGEVEAADDGFNVGDEQANDNGRR